jgi:hypothetical protein
MSQRLADILVLQDLFAEPGKLGLGWPLVGVSHDASVRNSLLIGFLPFQRFPAKLEPFL